ncbi:ribosomal protein S5 domain 2-type protein [Podospora aff. communis PSN243]|uniref:Phosphomevalonate kinase n=1 Tax=Podospora aff. communis PSN243 TaxID=3040156 RepID=A0AAV9H614_9PEZI|nr:ribosomal protein S5 domain 2-type protein [Podospora aff. communis PSN243]
MGVAEHGTAVSAPGKVMLAGGYLVLDRAYTGLVFGLSARINVIAQEIHTSEGVHLTEIVVESPQFLDAQWRYGYHLAEADGGIKVTQLHVGSHLTANPFVETTLNFALTFIARTSKHRPSHAVKSARLTILADNDYYSQPSSSPPPAPKSNNSSPSSTTTPPASTLNALTTSRFARFPVPLSGAHKTGLGSSAALVTALTAALLSHYLPPTLFDLTSSQGNKTLHNLAQAAHCAAQGKVGSGFDVAAAVYGSSLYRRFSPSVLSSLPEAGAPGFAPALEKVVNDEDGTIWDTEIRKDAVSLPDGMAVRMCDVDCGSQTVGMVKSVLAWRAKEEKSAGELWGELQGRNEHLAEVLRGGRTEEVRRAVKGVRELVRKMGRESGVPIEPESQTELLDALEGVEGVYGGVVPGAGGYDALALLVRDDKETERRVEEFVEAWSREKGSRVRLLPVRGEMEGARREDLGIYEGWIR